MSDKAPHLRFYAKLVKVHMAFQSRGGTYKWTLITQNQRITRSKYLKKKANKISWFHLGPLVKYIIEVLETHDGEKSNICKPLC